mgnify:CR=1 FL=1
MLYTMMQVCKETGMTYQALKFYCNEGLVPNVKRDKNGRLVYTLRDAPSNTGTFYMNDILTDYDRVRLEDGSIVTIGATTLILRAAREE